MQSMHSEACSLSTTSLTTLILEREKKKLQFLYFFPFLYISKFEVDGGLRDLPYFASELRELPEI